MPRKDVSDSSREEENSIPHSRVTEMIEKAKGEHTAQLQAERERSQRLETLLASVATNKQGGNETRPTAPPKWTREALASKVESKELSAEQAGAIWQRQEIDDRVTEKVAAVESRLRQEQRQTASAATLQSQIDDYKSSIPDVMKEGSEERDRLKEEYGWLIKQGHQPGLHTEILALRSAFGPPPKGRSKETTNQRPATRETSSGRGATNSRKKSNSSDGSDIEMTDRQREMYEHRVKSGQMSWNDIRTRFKRVRERRDARPNQVLMHGS